MNRARGFANGTHTHPEKRPRGMRHGSAKLTDADVALIRDLHSRVGESKKGLAKQFGVSRWTIDGIIQRKKWRHVP